MPRHRCDERSIDYSTAVDGYLVCAVCRRSWELDLKLGWVVSIREPAPPRAIA